MFAAYDCNINTVYFDDISLRKEPCTTYTYDDKGNITAVNATGNSGADFTYASGTTKLTKSVTESNGTYTYEYKDSNNDHLVTKIKNDGVSMSITYDAMGNSTATTLASDSNTSIGSIKTSASYSADGSQLVSQTNSSGYTTSYGYNDKRQLNETTDNAGTAVQQTYYDSQRPKTTYISGVISVLNSYSKGSLTKIDRGGYITGNSTKQNQYYNLTYDGFGNMTKIAIGSRVLATYDYGSHNQNLSSMTYGNGSSLSYTYDNLDRVVLEKNDTTTYEYFYDSEGNLAKKVDKTTGKAVNYQYDSLGRLIHSYQSDGSSIVQRTEHIYDTSNRISSQSWQLGDTTYSESYAYDADDGSLLSLTGAGGVVSYSFGYDALKRLAYRYNYYFRQDYTYRDISSGSQTTTQVSSIAYSQRPGGTNFSAFTLGYIYDKLGNISKVTGTNNTAQNASYTYDQQGQLTKEVNTKGTYNYTYDTYGNIRSVSGAESHTYTYGNSEWLDLLTAYDDHSISYDAIGNPTNWYNTKAWNFTWQNGRQLTKATSGNTTVSYTYDVAGIRDSKTVGSTVYNYLTQNGKVVRQTWGSHTLDIIYDNQGNPSCCIYDGTKYIYVLNLQGDVIRLVTTTGSTVASYVYDAWGNVISSSGTMADINPIRYRGYYYDTETKLYYLGSRYYDPAVKRFVNADESSYVLITVSGVSDKNLFSYCLNSPVSNHDSSGTIINTVIGAVVGAGFSCITALASGTTGKDLLAETVSGAISGAVSGAVVDTIAVTGGTALAVVAAYSAAGGFGSALGEIAKCKVNGTSIKVSNVASEACIGAAYGMLSGATTGPVKSIAKTAKKQGMTLMKKLTNKAVNFVRQKPLKNIIRRSGEEAFSNVVTWTTRQYASAVYKYYRRSYAK